MKRPVLVHSLIAPLIAIIAGCGILPQVGTKEEAPGRQMSLSAVPEPARGVIEDFTAHGAIKGIEEEQMDGKVVYSVEATVGQKDVEYDVASDGALLTVEESIPYVSLPAAVRSAVEKYFGSAAGLSAAREVEGSKTYYEVEGHKRAHRVTLKLTETGRIVEKER